MSIKIDRIDSTLVKEISYILATEVKDNNIRFVTVTDVKTTNDLSDAKVYVTILNDGSKEAAMKALKNASGFVRKQLYNRVDLRHVPVLQFVYDESIDYGKKIEKLIDNLNK